MTNDHITIPEVLRSWRDRICFADAVRLKDGRHGTVVRGGPVMPLQLEVIVAPPGDVMYRDSTKEIVFRDDLFPAWWPERQFHKTQEQSGAE